MQPSEDECTIRELVGSIWTLLAMACHYPEEPWRLPVLTTLGESGPQARTVVLRETVPSARRLVAWTDVRSPKVAELRRDPRAQWLFYDARSGQQLRAASMVEVHHADSVTESAWVTVPASNRANYLQDLAPGTVVGPRDPRRFTEPTEWPSHFAVLVATVHELDWLWLCPDGHRRARFCWDGERWGGQWLVP
ncbi:MAG TPA: pyridoxamine 5'-phosphate oxidase family protein [Candidatus Limnocylindria bacterium]|jgi:hypothetical protein|nr:pyridoxamine 5'-phosphate oxidase family protein [Candidatus Limnocylindria bacterium]